MTKVLCEQFQGHLIGHDQIDKNVFSSQRIECWLVDYNGFFPILKPIDYIWVKAQDKRQENFTGTCSS